MDSPKPCQGLFDYGVVDNHARHWMAVFLFFWRVHAMCSNVHSKTMYLSLNGKIFKLTKMICVVFLEHRNCAAGTSDVDAVQARIEFDDVTSSRCGQMRNRLMSIKIDHGHHVVPFALEKRAMIFGIERHSVIAFALSYRVTPNNFVGGWIDHS